MTIPALKGKNFLLGFGLIISQLSANNQLSSQPAIIELLFLHAIQELDCIRAFFTMFSHILP